MITWHNVEQGSEEWHALRKPLWTGSRAIRLLQGKALVEDTDWRGNDATRRGHMLEFAAIREYERKYNTKVQRPGFVTNSVYPNAGYSPDGIDRLWLLETKAFVGKNYEKLIISGTDAKDLDKVIASRIPLQIKSQIFFGMIVTGLRRARLLAINPDMQEQLIVIEIGYDRLIGDNIRKKLRLDMKNRQPT